MPAASFTNPNVCPGCVQLLDDDSPQTMTLHTSLTNEPAAPTHGAETEHSILTPHQVLH